MILQSTVLLLSGGGGVAFAEGGLFLGEDYFEGEALACRLNQCESYDAFKQFAAQANGCFSLVRRQGDEVWLAVDRQRHDPLFYTLGSDGAFHVSCDANLLVPLLADNSYDEDAYGEFMRMGYVTGGKTLAKEIRQLPAASVCRIADGKACTEIYFSYECRPAEWANAGEDEKLRRLDDALMNAARRLVRSVNGRTIALALSGGQDSRLLAVLLHRLGYEKVVCFTFGDPDGMEYARAKEVCAKLGYRHIFVPYTAQMWKPLLQEGAGDEFLRYAGNLASVPHLAACFCAREIASQLPSDAVIITGGSYDVLTGSHVAKHVLLNKTVSRRFLKTRLEEYHCGLHRGWEPAVRRMLRLTKPEVFGGGRVSQSEGCRILQQWDMAQRQSLFITNTFRVYEYNGFDWRDPLWDNDLSQFWQSVAPMDFYARQLHYRYAHRYMTPYTGMDSPIPNPASRRDVLIHKNALVRACGMAFVSARRVHRQKSAFAHDPIRYFDCFDSAYLMKRAREVGGGFNGNTLNIEMYLKLADSVLAHKPKPDKE